MFLFCTTNTDADRARKHGLDEFVQAEPSKYDHADFFRTLQSLTLDYRLNDAFTCLVCYPKTIRNLLYRYKSIK